MEKVIGVKNIEKLIFEVRGKQVMLDSDLARLYGCKNGTKEINQAVKRNIGRFPERYMFQLNKEEFDEISEYKNDLQYSKSRFLPYVFTEQGVVMLSTVLKTEEANVIGTKIIDYFVCGRKYVDTSSIIQNQEKRIQELEELFDKLSIKRNTIIYEDTVYDASSALIDILNEANNEIIIADNYASKELFDILRNIDKRITIISKNLGDALMKKYSEQYSNIKFKNSNKFHDRYIILDRRDLYISGMSLKDIGKKYSYIYKINDKEIADAIINEVCQNI